MTVVPVEKFEIFFCQVIKGCSNSTRGKYPIHRENIYGYNFDLFLLIEHAPYCTQTGKNQVV